uniref:ubiquitinyl hydrolase 1 n=1 Tax=Myotis myotis TaxID=51298 RepID=A0A7J7UEX2_MYOMY|nr:ubiquitin specific peptidase 4 [Myotis myotis]
MFPGPIDNSGLFSDPESQTLKEHLIDELDYVLVPTEAWNKLINWYGCVEGQQPIVRKVVEYGLFVKHCKVEVYLLELKLCENSDPTNMRSCHFSKADTIGEQLGRALGPIGESAEHCGWWEGGWVPSSDFLPGHLGLGLPVLTWELPPRVFLRGAKPESHIL